MAKTKERATINGHFPVGSGIQPKGFKGLGTGETVTVVTKGKVTQVQDKADRWDPGKRFTVEVTSCEIVTPESNRKVSISDALKAARKRV